MLVFDERGKLEYLGKNVSEQSDWNFVTIILPDVTLRRRKIDWCKLRAFDRIGFF